MTALFLAIKGVTGLWPMVGVATLALILVIRKFTNFGARIKAYWAQRQLEKSIVSVNESARSDYNKALDELKAIQALPIPTEPDKLARHTQELSDAKNRSKNAARNLIRFRNPGKR